MVQECSICRIKYLSSPLSAPFFQSVQVCACTIQATIHKHQKHCNIYKNPRSP